MHEMNRLPMPLALPMWELACLYASRPELHALLGKPHVVETDSTRTAGGNEEAWAFTLPSGQRMLVILAVLYERVALCGDPPELGPILQTLRISPDNPRLTRYAQPVGLS